MKIALRTSRILPLGARIARTVLFCFDFLPGGVLCITYRSGWWFGTCFIFSYIGNNHPNWLLFFRGVQTTKQWWCIWWCDMLWLLWMIAVQLSKVEVDGFFTLPHAQESRFSSILAWPAWRSSLGRGFSTHWWRICIGWHHQPTYWWRICIPELWQMRWCIDVYWMTIPWQLPVDTYDLDHFSRWKSGVVRCTGMPAGVCKDIPMRASWRSCAPLVGVKGKIYRKPWNSKADSRKWRFPKMIKMGVASHPLISSDCPL